MQVTNIDGVLVISYINERHVIIDISASKNK